MPIEPSAISGINPSGATQNVAVDNSGRVITSSTTGGNSALNTSTAAAIASVIGTTSGATVLQAANTSRKGLIAYSCSASGGPALIAYTTAATTSVFSVALNPGGYWEMPVPLSALGMSVIVAATGVTATLQVTELT